MQAACDAPRGPRRLAPANTNASTRAVRTRGLERHLAPPALQSPARTKPRCALEFDCPIQRGLRDGIGRIGKSCIDTQLAHALRDDVGKRLFVRGAGPRSRPL